MSQNTNIQASTNNGLSEKKKKIRHTTIIELGLMAAAVAVAVVVAAKLPKE